MSRRALSVGSFVHFIGFGASGREAPLPYRIEGLMHLDDGATLYTIRNDAEPFDRVVVEHDLAKS